MAKDAAAQASLADLTYQSWLTRGLQQSEQEGPRDHEKLFVLCEKEEYERVLSGMQKHRVKLRL